MKRAPEMLEAAAETFRERNKVYGDNYRDQFGKVMRALFPNGVWAITEDDWNRLGILVQIVAKLTRYGNQFKEGGHQDSIHDIIVYSAMLEEIDAEIKARPKTEPRHGVMEMVPNPSVCGCRWRFVAGGSTGELDCQRQVNVICRKYSTFDKPGDTSP